MRRGDVTNREGTHGSFSIAGGTGGHYRRDRRHCAVERPERATSLNSLLLEYAKEKNFFLLAIPAGLNGWLWSNDIQPGSDVQDETVGSALGFIERTFDSNVSMGASCVSQKDEKGDFVWQTVN